MKSGASFPLILLNLACLLTQNANAGSAVAIAHVGSRTILPNSCGLPKKVAEQHVLTFCRSRGGADARILASTDVVGEGAIAVGHRASGLAIGVSLGRSSPQDAANRAIQACQKAGGADPKIIRAFKG
jgi:uncharacterized protein DUF4189